MQKLIWLVKEFFQGVFTIDNNGDGTSTLLMLFPFLPFEESTFEESIFFVDNYYFNSNKNYIFSKKVVAELCLHGFDASFHLQHDIKDKLVKTGAGTRSKNDLVFNDEYGTFFNVVAIDVKGGFSLSIGQNHHDCGICSLCQKCCPSQALSDRFDQSRCLRAWHEKFEEAPQEIVDLNKNRLLGCNTCQLVCPDNGKDRLQMPKEIESLLKKGEILKNIQPLQEHLGKNQIRKIRLEKQVAKMIGSFEKTV